MLCWEKANAKENDTKTFGQHGEKNKRNSLKRKTDKRVPNATIVYF